MSERRRFTVKRYPEYGWAVLDNGVRQGDGRGPWWPNRKAALLEAEKRIADQYRCQHTGREDEHCPCVDPGNENGPAGAGRVSA